ncbi:MAG TPA: Lrp/AsnC family transcriptional regulator [Chloroflexia bacterium]|nr:Lrp/AsnC family transcriptional regulator [Chloroflexia bacterium]
MQSPIDAIDKMILDLLQTDARTPLATIARAVGLSGAAVAERVRKLESSGVIRGYTAIVDREKLGKPLTAFIRVTLQPARGTGWGGPAEALAVDPDVLEIHHVAGEDCLILKVHAADPRGIEALLTRLRDRVEVTRTVTMIVLSTVKEDCRFSWHADTH